MDFNQHKEDINANFEQLLESLGKLIPRYSQLIKKSSISQEETTELGDIEHFLIEINARISEIKNKLDQDLFGHSLDLYYKLKQQALNGDVASQLKFNRFRESFDESLRDGSILILN